MNKKKLTIIVCSVLAVLVVGLLVNHFFNWPIDSSDASGDISKASRFSREMESEKLTNMEELLKTDTTFKDGIVVAQMVMQTRAVQFGALVDMSNQVAGKIPAFAEVLKEMNATLEMVNNVAKSRETILKPPSAEINALILSRPPSMPRWLIPPCRSRTSWQINSSIQPISI